MNYLSSLLENFRKRSAINRAYMQAVMLLERTPSDKGVTINITDGSFSISYSSTPTK